MSPPYDRFKNNELILRDELAVDRTLLANERTLLAYLRSAISLLLAGVTFIQFGSDMWFKGIGYLCLPVGIALGIFGQHRYRQMDNAIRTVRRQMPQVPGATPAADE
jgi:putative membrane protein